MSEATRPEAFDDIFSRPGVIVVGGHAVNLWASYYAPRGDKELRSFAPFLSKDGDIFLRDKDLARAVAAAAGWKFRNNPEVRSPVLGHIYALKEYLRARGPQLKVPLTGIITNPWAGDGQLIVMPPEP